MPSYNAMRQVMYARWKSGERLSDYDYQKYIVPVLKPKGGNGGYKNMVYYSSRYNWS